MPLRKPDEVRRAVGFGLIFTVEGVGVGWWESYAIRKAGKLFPGLVASPNLAPDGVKFWACSLRDAVFGSGHDDSRVDKLGYGLGGRILYRKTVWVHHCFSVFLGFQALFEALDGLLMGF